MDAIICSKCKNITVLNESEKRDCCSVCGSSFGKEKTKVDVKFLKDSIALAESLIKDFQDNNARICRTTEDYEDVARINDYLYAIALKNYLEIFNLKSSSELFLIYFKYMDQMARYMEIEKRISDKLAYKANGHMYTAISYIIDNNKKKHELSKFNEIQKQTLYKTETIKEKNYLELIRESVNDLIVKEYTCDLINGTYVYSDNVKVAIDYLSELGFKSTASTQYKDFIQKEKNINDLDYEDCLTYFEWVWYLESNTIGTVKKELENSRYALVLAKLCDLINRNELENTIPQNKDILVLKEAKKNIVFRITSNRKENLSCEDALVITSNNIDAQECLKLIEKTYTEDIVVPIKFIDVYNIFHKSGIWQYNEYTFDSQEIDTLDIYKSFKNTTECFCIFTIGDKVTMYDLDCVLENINKEKAGMNITNSCIFDEKLEQTEIHLSVYKRN